nr:hypothetical protein [Candidatus Limiplasma sp.]
MRSLIIRKHALSVCIFVIIYLLFSLITITTACAEVLIQTVDFEVDGAGYSVTGGPLVTSVDDIWTRVNGSEAGTTFSPMDAFTDYQGSYYFYGEDTDNGLGTADTPAYVTLDAIDVSGYRYLKVSLLVAAKDSSGAVYEATEYLKVQYAFDGGAYTSLAQYISEINSEYLSEDSDADGTIDGGQVTHAFQEYTYNIPSFGDSLQIRIACNSNSGNEEMGFDNIRISGTASTDPSYEATISPLNKTFNKAIQGYGIRTPQVFTVQNTGTGTITALSASLQSGASFEISSALSAASISTAHTASVSVRPKTGLSVGTYTDTLTITGNTGILLTANLSFTVTAPYTGTVLGPGDIVILEFNGNGTDGFTFMPLVDLIAGTEINFTDFGWNATINSFHTAEDGNTLGGGNMITYKAPTAISAGTLIRQDSANTGGAAFTETTDYSRYNYNNLNYINSFITTSAGHDGLIAFQGLSVEPTFLFAVQTGHWGSESEYYYWSDLPTGLTNGVNALYLPDLTSGTDLTVDDGFYSGLSTETTAEDWSTRVSTLSNWTTLASGTAPTLLYPGSYHVTAPSYTYTATVSPTSKTYTAATAGYGAQTAQEFTVTNTGTGSLTNLSAALTTGTSFEISTALSATTVAASGTATVSVRPVTGLSAGTYTDTLTITG